MTIFRRLVGSAAFMVAVVVRRRRSAYDDGLDLPEYLRPGAALSDPEGWKRGRTAWGREHDWGPQKLGYLRFFDETVYVYRTAIGDTPPIGCSQRYLNRRQ